MQAVINTIKKHFHGESLKSRTFRGGFWLGLGSGSEQGLRFLRNIILTRILAPEAFGLMAIIVAVNSAFDAFTQLGIKEAIIQNPKGEEEEYLNGAWFTSFGRSIGLFIIGVVSSVWISRYYEIPQHAAMFQVSFLNMLFSGAFSAKAYVALKQMDYKKWGIITNGGGIIGIMTAIGLSFVLHSVWALIFGFLVEAGARCLLSYVVCPYLPRLRFKKEHIHALLKYASGMFGLPILYIIYAQADIFVIGKMFSGNELGLYSMVAALANAPSIFITTLINPILMPVLSQKQDDKAWINKAIITSSRLILIAGFPLVLFIAFYGEDILKVAYGPPYAVLALPFTLLVATTIMRTASVPIFNVYLSLGRPELHRFFLAIRAVLICILIYPAIKLFGLSGAALAMLFSNAVSLIFQVMRIKSITGLVISKFNYIFIEAMAYSTVVAMVWVTSQLFKSTTPAGNILYGLGGCAFCYGILSIYIMKRGRISL